MILLTAVLAATLAATPVKLPAGGEGRLWKPEGKAPRPAVLLLEGWFQPGTWEESVAERLAKRGWLVLALQPDRPRPKEGDRDGLHALMAAPPTGETRTQIAGAVAWLRAREDVGRIAVVGARMGGRDAMFMAGAEHVAAAVSWYGSPAVDPALVRAPVLAFFGGKDFGPTAEDARRFEAAAVRGRAPVQVYVYPEAQHGFADPKNPWGGYDKASADDSWDRAVTFLARHLEPGR
jgi:carboxymethylenebutenolidase